jgi:hypothetical protein
MGEATGAEPKRKAHGSLLLDDSCENATVSAAWPLVSRSSAWPRVGKRARIELVIYPVAADELWDAKGTKGVVESLVHPVHVVLRGLFPLFPLTVSMCEDACKSPANSICSPHWHGIMKLLSSSPAVRLCYGCPRRAMP